MVRIRSLIPVLGLLLVLAGCSLMNPYEGVPPGYASWGRPLTAEDVDHQDTEVQPRCGEWVDESNPSTARMMTTYAGNNLIGGGLGGMGGFAADMAITGSGIGFLPVLGG